MLIFVLFQNPLYIAIECTNIIRPIVIPGNHTKEIGYADDTNLFISDDESLIEAFKIIESFEKATNSKINIGKTRVYGFGAWERRRLWPIRDLKVEE